ncbi:unnamed protein product [Coffea canephora]|uniref:Uncharacterized protein n=1 Tax=Coffea canephora TaxID=49390 RepID=A0A068TNX7_COFCA|nr:unnamed protein product [Coffea canephora]
MTANSSQESLVVASVIFAILILSSTIPPALAAGITGLTHRELMQKPHCPPCLCCQRKLPPPECCYCACFVTESGNKAP